MQVQVCALVKLFFYMYLFLDLFLSMAQHSHSAVATKKARKAQKLQSHHPTKLKQWKDEQMRKAMDAVINGELGVNRAALEFGVPKTTLKDIISRKLIYGSNPGPVPFLTPQEEEQLVNFLFECSRMRYSKTKCEVIQIVEAGLRKKEKVGNQ